MQITCVLFLNIYLYYFKLPVCVPVQVLQVGAGAGRGQRSWHALKLAGAAGSYEPLAQSGCWESYVGPAGMLSHGSSLDFR